VSKSFILSIKIWW